MNTPIYWLDNAENADINLMGGKGANLAELMRAGFPEGRLRSGRLCRAFPAVR